MNRQYIGARYVPIFDGDWNSAKVYEPLTIVNYNGGSYTSKKTCPAGTLPTNTDYWALSGTYNGQIAALQQDVANLQESDAYITNRISVLPPVYDNTNTYSAGQYVQYANAVYVCVATSTGHLPTDTNYWSYVGNIEKQFEDVANELDLKAAKALFTPTNISIPLIDLSTYTTADCAINCVQVGRILILSFALNFIGTGVDLPANTVLNTTAIPCSISANLGFNVASSDDDVARMLITTGGMISNLSALKAGKTYEGQLILPSYGWI